MSTVGRTGIGLVRGVRQTMTLGWRSLAQLKHTPADLVGYIVQPLVALVLFTYVFGGAIAGSTGHYLKLALPGIVAQWIFFASASTGVGLNADLTTGVFDRLSSLPVARWAPLAGRILADGVKDLWGFALILGAGLVLGFRADTDLARLLGACALVMVLALVAPWIMVLIAVGAPRVETVQVAAWNLFFPLAFTSNAFVPIQTMPGWLQAWAKVNPVSVFADAIRGLLVGGPVAAPVGRSLLWLAAIAVVFVPLSVRAFRRRA